MAERVQELQRTLQTELEVFRQMQAGESVAVRWQP